MDLAYVLSSSFSIVTIAMLRLYTRRIQLATFCLKRCMHNTIDACSNEHNLQSCFVYSLQDLGYVSEVGRESSLTTSAYQNATQVIVF